MNETQSPFACQCVYPALLYCLFDIIAHLLGKEFKIRHQGQRIISTLPSTLLNELSKNCLIYIGVLVRNCHKNYFRILPTLDKTTQINAFFKLNRYVTRSMPSYINNYRNLSSPYFDEFPQL